VNLKELGFEGPYDRVAAATQGSNQIGSAKRMHPDRLLGDYQLFSAA
jgi:hypothetical protein